MEPDSSTVISAVATAPPAAFAVIKDECGSLDGYLERVVGLDADAREQMRAHILL